MMHLTGARGLILEAARVKSNTRFYSGSVNFHFVDNTKILELRNNTRKSAF